MNSDGNYLVSGSAVPEKLFDLVREFTSDKVLDCLIENCNVEKNTFSLCEYFAKHNDFPHVEMSHKAGYSLSSAVISSALEHGNFDMLLYADQNGCPYDRLLIHAEALLGRNRECFEYVNSMLDRDTISHVSCDLDNLDESESDEETILPTE